MMKGLAKKRDRGKSALGGLALMWLNLSHFEFHSLQQNWKKVPSLHSYPVIYTEKNTFLMSVKCIRSPSFTQILIDVLPCWISA